MFLSGVRALSDTDLTGALAEDLHPGSDESLMVRERGARACSAGLLVGSHLTGLVRGCKAHSVANLPSLAPGCGSLGLWLGESLLSEVHHCK